MKLQFKDEFAGRSSTCPRCRKTLSLPQPEKGLVTSDTLVGPPSSSQQAGINATMSLPAAAQTNQAGDRTIEDVLVGQNASGSRYLLEGEIARGGMGAILRGIDRDLRREVAVKVMLDAQNSRQKARFVEEAQITGQLEHPNIVPVHELGVDEQKRPYFSMKMVRGRSLAQIIETLRDRPAEATEYTQGRLVNILVGVCHALAYAHSRGVLHRDLKPANIMVGDFGEVYVMDWGLAKVISGVPEALAVSEDGKTIADVAALSRAVVTSRDGSNDKTLDGTIVGTPAYMAPEQALSQPIDQRSDIYALGGILYSVLTLKPPVELQCDYMGLLMAVAEGHIIPPEKRTPKRAGQIPPELSAIAMKALAKEPGLRYESVEAFRRDLELYLEGRAVSAKADSTWEMAVKFVKRNKGFSAAALVGSVLLMLVLAGSSVINYRARVKADEARDQADAARIEAETAHANFLTAQEEKRKQAKASAPAFLRAAQLMTNQQNFSDALAQVTTALDADPGLTEAYLFKGQLLIGLERYAEAVAPLAEYVKRNRDDSLSERLVDLARHPDPDQAAYLWALWEVFDKQQALSLAGRMAQLAERFAGAGKELLAAYRKRIDAIPGWAGKSRGLSIDKNGKLRLSLASQKDLRDLTPLKGMQLTSLDLYATPVQDLTPLQGMPLTRLVLRACADVTDLEPLRGMKLTWLHIGELTKISSLEPLRGMPLEFLNMSFCHEITDLEPLRGMPLTELDCGSYGRMKLSNLEPLTGLKLKRLSLSQARHIKDIRPLRNMPLEKLNLGVGMELRDFEPLRGMPLKVLEMPATSIRDLELLKGMPLTMLNVGLCYNVKDLTPLADMPLTDLNLARTPVRDLSPLAKLKLTRLVLSDCKHIENFDVVKNMPLTDLMLLNCGQLRDLELVRGLKLQTLRIRGCTQIDDLTPLAGMELRIIELTPRFIKKGWEVLRSMKSLDTVSVEGRPAFSATEFWRLHEKGEFK